MEGAAFTTTAPHTNIRPINPLFQAHKPITLWTADICSLEYVVHEWQGFLLNTVASHSCFQARKQPRLNPSSGILTATYSAIENDALELGLKSNNAQHPGIMHQRLAFAKSNPPDAHIIHTPPLCSHNRYSILHVSFHGFNNEPICSRCGLSFTKAAAGVSFSGRSRDSSSCQPATKSSAMFISMLGRMWLIGCR